MKLLSNKTLLILLVLISGYGYVISCTHDNEIAPPPAPIGIKYTAGTEVFLPGNMTAGNKSEWKLDKVHSSALWTTAYVGASGLLTGRFNSFGIHDVTAAKMTKYPYTDLYNPSQPLKDSSWAFYENDDSKTYINGYVQINTSNTGEPKRDGSLFDPTIGCNLSTLGTVAQIQYQHNLEVNNLAKIQSTKVSFDPTTGDYIVNLNLTWQGKLGAPITKALVGKMKYIKKATIATASPYDVFGLQLNFQFNCRDFGITSTSIGDKIDIQCNMNFNNK